MKYVSDGYILVTHPDDGPHVDLDSMCGSFADATAYGAEHYSEIPYAVCKCRLIVVLKTDKLPHVRQQLLML